MASPQFQLRQSTPQPPLPSAPDPSTDPGVVPPITSPSPNDCVVPREEPDIFVLPPLAALRMLCRNVDALVKLTGDIPPTPPSQNGKDSPGQVVHSGGKADSGAKENVAFANLDKSAVPQTAIGSPEAHQDETINIIEAQAERTSVQQGVIAPVYLATSLYITRLAVVERVIPVTPRNVHRLLLAGLRVAMKALEDLSYPHSRFAKVGGVSETELGRLEVTFCFLANFELKVDSAMLQAEFAAPQDADVHGEKTAQLKLVLPTGEKRKASSALTTMPVAATVEAPS